MNLIFNSIIIRLLWWIFAPILSALILISIFYIIKSDSYRINEDDIINLKIDKKYSFPNFFIHIKSKQNSKRADSKSAKLYDLVLKACYVEDGNSFIMFEDKSGKIDFLSINQRYKGAKLIKVEIDKATFLQNSKEIVIELKKGEEEAKENIVSIPLTKEKIDDKYKKIGRVSFKNYIDNPKKALKDIRFRELRQKGKFMGLSLNFVRKNSFFEKMGLKKGDIIKSIDGKEITGLVDLLPYYNNINNITTIELGIVRDGDFKELIYEID